MAAAVATSAVFHPPASPFAELLRRSRFATFDPAIRQVYASPPEHASRGDWGLKRPISLRRRNAFIALKQFESFANFAEWNHAESQVRFIRRVGEMNLTPVVANKTPWDQQLGQAKTQWVLDSEYCPAAEEEEWMANVSTPVREDLKGLGEKGEGHYGAQRPMLTTEGRPRAGKTHVQPNIYAMTPREFNNYIQKLRKLRPQFYAHIQQVADKYPDHKEMKGKSLYQIAQANNMDYHRRFLAEVTEVEFSDRKKQLIEQQPHPFGGLTYAHPSKLDTYFTTKPEPGLVLQIKEDDKASKFSRSEEQFAKPYVVSFGGIAAKLDRQYVDGEAPVPLFDPHSEEGIKPSVNVEASVKMMRVLPKGLRLDKPPKVVGRNSEGLKGTKLQVDVQVDRPHRERQLENPYWPGSREYVGTAPFALQTMPAVKLNTGYSSKGVVYSINKGRMEKKSVIPNFGQGTRKSRSQSPIISALQSMVKKTSEDDGTGSEGL